MTSIVEKDITVNENSKATPNNSPPMAVLPLNSSTKLDQEPNPFEQSFSGAAADEKSPTIVKLPPVASITSPVVKPSSVVPVIGGGILPKEVSNQFNWDTLRTGPLSPSMLQGPANPEEYYSSKGQLIPPNNYSARSSFSSSTTNDIQYMQQQPQQHSVKVESQSRMRQQRKQSEDSGSIDSNISVIKSNKRNRRRSSVMDDSEEEDSKKRTRVSDSKEPEDDEKRKNFLERNRIAALKCRQRKKQWLNNLQAKVEFLSNDNERLQVQSDALKEEIVNLKTLLLAHKECPVAQSNGFHASSIQKAMPGMLSQQQHMMRNAHPYGNRPSQPQPPQPQQQQQPQPQPSTQNSLSSSSIPRFQRANMVGLPTQGQQEPTNQQGMIAGGGGTGGSSSVLRF